MRKLYIATTPDRYELPFAVSDTPKGLAEMCGTTPGTVLSEISHAARFKRHRTYYRISYTEREWNE